MGSAQQRPAARDKHAHTLRFYPEDNLYRDLTDNMHESHRFCTGLPECKERQTKAGAFYIQVQARLTLEFPHSVNRLFMLVCTAAGEIFRIARPVIA